MWSGFFWPLRAVFSVLRIDDEGIVRRSQMMIRVTCLLALVLGTSAHRLLFAAEARTVDEFVGAQGRQL